MTPIERLIQQEALVDLIIEHQYVPQRSAQNFNQMLAALREVNPGAIYNPACQGCMSEIARAAKLFINLERERMNKLAQEAMFMTFPKHEQPSMEIKSMEIVKQQPPEVKEEPKKRGRKPKQ
jgi:hypothetical protein